MTLKQTHMRYDLARRADMLPYLGPDRQLTFQIPGKLGFLLFTQLKISKKRARQIALDALAEYGLNKLARKQPPVHSKPCTTADLRTL